MWRTGRLGLDETPSMRIPIHVDLLPTHFTTQRDVVPPHCPSRQVTTALGYPQVGEGKEWLGGHALIVQDPPTSNTASSPSGQAFPWTGR